jgi:SPP1 family holin
MNKIKDIFANISNVKVGTWVRGILLIISFVNMALSAAGKTPIPTDYNELYTIVSVIFSVLVGISAYWKNNSFTEAAQTADKFLHEQGDAKEDAGE